MTTYKAKFDKVSIAVSLACMVHCIALPMLLTTLPFFGIEILENLFIELATIFVAVAIGGWSVWNGYQKHHRRPGIPILFLTGICVMSSANFLQMEKLEMVGKGMGAALLIAAHILNWKQSQQCSVC